MALICVGHGAWANVSVKDFLTDLELEHLLHILEREQISMDVLMDMSHDDLSSVGVTAFGHRHRILRKVRELAHNGGAEPAVPVGVSTASHVGTRLIDLPHSDKDYIAVSEEVRRNNEAAMIDVPRPFKGFLVVKVVSSNYKHALNHPIPGENTWWKFVLSAFLSLASIYTCWSKRCCFRVKLDSALALFM